MKDFADTTKTAYVSGCYARGGAVRGAAKVSKVMSEFKAGTLRSSSRTGPKAASRKQAVAIALGEADRGGEGRG